LNFTVHAVKQLIGITLKNNEQENRENRETERKRKTIGRWFKPSHAVCYSGFC